MFDQIEAKREAAGISQADLCARAGVHETTYTARKSLRRGMSEKTICKLKVALDALITERLERMEKVAS